MLVLYTHNYERGGTQSLLDNIQYVYENNIVINPAILKIFLKIVTKILF